LSLKRDDPGILPNPGSIGGITRARDGVRWLFGLYLAHGVGGCCACSQPMVWFWRL